ncbi:hemerythrin domain-containing protein [Paraburkholderia azotifigens]|uniref:hemerythrin domain-containing protein n=1 Tax=Paraburkholderia azotifigens TaxID=2057004 RepID=UPI00317D7783
MYRHFFVPVGGTDAAIEAVGHALEFARSIGARVTFFDACSEASAENRAAERFAKAEAAARAQGVPCASASRAPAHGANLALEVVVALARAHGCDLLCAPTDAPWLIRRQHAGDAFASCGMPVLMCAAPRHRVADLVIAKLLGQHRAIGAQLHDLLGEMHAAVSRSEPSGIAMEPLVAALREVQSLRDRPGRDACVFSRLRERTSAFDAELDELEHQHRHEAGLFGALLDSARAAAKGELPLACFEQQLQTCAQFIWEHMGREEGVILPAARRYLSDADWQEIGAALAVGAPSTNLEHTIGELRSSRA